MNIMISIIQTLSRPFQSLLDFMGNDYYGIRSSALTTILWIILIAVSIYFSLVLKSARDLFFPIFLFFGFLILLILLILFDAYYFENMPIIAGTADVPKGLETGSIPTVGFFSNTIQPPKYIFVFMVIYFIVVGIMSFFAPEPAASSGLSDAHNESSGLGESSGPSKPSSALAPILGGGTVMLLTKALLSLFNGLIGCGFQMNSIKLLLRFASVSVFSLVFLLLPFVSNLFTAGGLDPAFIISISKVLLYGVVMSVLMWILDNGAQLIDKYIKN